MQTVSFQQSSRASSNPLIFTCHQSESTAQDIDHRDICSAVRAWAAVEGRIAVCIAASIPRPCRKERLVCLPDGQVGKRGE